MLARANRLAANLTRSRSLSLSSSNIRRLASGAMASAATLQAPVVTPVRFSDLHESRPTWWLRSLFHFSFADWYEPSRDHLGALRVVNDDQVQPHAGFGTHPHRDMEIFSYVVDGQLTHQDSMGNKEALSRGSVQYMSAGSGVRHSEMNEGDEVCRFLQMWIVPDKRGHAPQYGSSVYTKADRHNRLLQILGGTTEAPAWKDAHDLRSIKLHQDANVYVSECDPDVRMDLQLGADRQAYLVCIEGSVAVNDVTLTARDAARIVGSPTTPSDLQLAVQGKGAHFLIVEMAKE